ncbi:membrane protein [Perilla frutescens var. hirtella]|nr:membrane protein [Perilla frutescens var. hirtella]
MTSNEEMVELDNANGNGDSDTYGNIRLRLRDPSKKVAQTKEMLSKQAVQTRKILSKQAVKIAKQAEEHERFINKGGK